MDIKNRIKFFSVSLVIIFAFCISFLFKIGTANAIDCSAPLPGNPTWTCELSDCGDSGTCWDQNPQPAELVGGSCSQYNCESGGAPTCGRGYVEEGYTSADYCMTGCFYVAINYSSYYGPGSVTCDTSPPGRGGTGCVCQFFVRSPCSVNIPVGEYYAYSEPYLCDPGGGEGGGAVCPNGIAESGESCDGSDLNGQNCVSLGFAGGSLACKSDCTFDTSSCTTGCVATGSGIGLTGKYYDGINFDSLITTRTDGTINFDPADSLGVSYANSPDGDTFSVRWEGQVEPRCSENYTFYTRTDDGVRLWVNGNLVIDKWVLQGPTEWSSNPIALTAGQKYTIKMEFYENGGGAVAQLSWSSPSTAKEIIPRTQLYPSCTPLTYQSATSGFSTSLSGPAQDSLSVNPGQTFYAFVDYGQFTDAIAGPTAPTVACAWDSAWIGTAARFRCIAPSSPGSYIYITGTNNYPSGSNICASGPTTMGTVTNLLPPVLSVNPASFNFTAFTGGADPIPSTLTISNTGGAGSVLSWSVTDSAAWLTVRRNLAGQETSGTENSGGSSIPPIIVTASAAGLSAGTYNATIAVTSNGGSVALPVTLTLVATPLPEVIATIAAVNNNASFSLDDIRDDDTLTFKIIYRNRAVAPVPATSVNAGITLSDNLINPRNFACTGVACIGSLYAFTTTAPLNPGQFFTVTFVADVQTLTSQPREFLYVFTSGNYQLGNVPFSSRYSLLVAPAELITPRFQEVSP